MDLSVLQKGKLSVDKIAKFDQGQLTIAHLFLEPYNWGPFLLEETRVLLVDLARHVCLLLEGVKGLVVAITQHVVRDRLVELLSLPLG